MADSEKAHNKSELGLSAAHTAKVASKDDSVTYRRKTRRSTKERPKTLTSGVALTDIMSQGKHTDIDIGEETLSFADIKKKFLNGDVSKTKEKKPESKTPKRARSGRRYKTITEGIAPSVLAEARASVGSNGVEPHETVALDKLTKTLTLSTENLNRKSFLVSDDKRGLAASSEHIAGFLKKKEEEKESGNTTEAEHPSVSSLKNRFLQAVEHDNTKHTSAVVRRQNKRNARKDRPHTICGIDDASMKQIEFEINHMNDEEKEKSLELNVRATAPASSVGHDDSLNYLFDDICRKEGISIDDLSKHLDDNLDDLLHSPVASKRFDFESGKSDSKKQEVLRKDSKTDDQTTIDQSSISRDENNINNNLPADDVTNDKTTSSPVDHTYNADFPEGGEELDIISNRSRSLLSVDSSRRNVRPKRTTRGSANPLKALKAREDVYEEQSSPETKEDILEQNDVTTKAAGESSMYRGRGTLSEKSKGQQLWRKVALANEAKQALMSNEDFSKVSLKKVQQAESQMGQSPELIDISKIDKVLVQVKGRRKVQSQVVEFSPVSLNSGDCYVLVLPKELYCWCGKQSNVIERAKAKEIASRIHQKKEMGCKAPTIIHIDQSSTSDLRFIKSLGGDKEDSRIKAAERAIADDEYEQDAISSYMVYELEDGEVPSLVPIPEMCSRMPSKDILKTNQAYFLDFVSEVYVWFGRQTTSAIRKKMQLLAKERFDKGHLVKMRHLSPVHASGARRISLTSQVGNILSHHADKSGSTQRSNAQKAQFDDAQFKKRPPFSIFVVLYEQSEWVLFKEKFCDWPDESRIIRMKGAPESRGEITKAVAPVDVKVVDPTEMVAPLGPLRSIVLEGTDLGRGKGKPDGFDGYHVITKNLEIWHVTENRHWPIAKSSYGQFHSGEGYVVRWEYSIILSRLIRTQADLQTAHGRQRFCYFFWLGNDCSVNEQGATAVMTVELDKEKGPQVRVLQGKEPPHFLNIFGGSMIIHAGKRPLENIRPTFTDLSVIRLYCIRGEDATEGCLMQVPASADSLRSRSSYVLLLSNQGEVFLWHGCKSGETTRSTALHCARKLIENHPEESAIGEVKEMFLTEIEEGQEVDVFWIALGGKEDYGSLLNDSKTDWNISPRLFRLSSATGEMISQEIVSPARINGINCPFPVLQDDLYNVDQPAIFILDAVREVYLWLGWWPNDEETEASASMKIRWDLDRRKAMESALLFVNAAGRSLTRSFVIDAGLEPDSFVDLFPYWVVQDDVTDIQLQDGVESDRIKLIISELKTFSKQYYTLSELKQRPPPQGVDPTKLETYLSDDDFTAVFKLNRQTFNEQPSWKKANLKRSLGLY